jgi:hypothetical protein
MSNTISLQSNANLTVATNGNIGINNPSPAAPLDVGGGYVAGTTGFSNGSTFVWFHDINFPNTSYGTSLTFSMNVIPTGGLQLFASGKTVSGFYACVNSGNANITVDYVAWAGNN